MSATAETQGQPLYEELMHFHRSRLARERENKRYALDSRRQAIERIGLLAVKQHRLKELEREESEWKRQVESRSSVHPELILRLILRVEGVGTNG
jgi:hypothetical protein